MTALRAWFLRLCIAVLVVVAVPRAAWAIEPAATIQEFEQNLTAKNGGVAKIPPNELSEYIQKSLAAFEKAGKGEQAMKALERAATKIASDGGKMGAQNGAALEAMKDALDKRGEGKRVVDIVDKRHMPFDETTKGPVRASVDEATRIMNSKDPIAEAQKAGYKLNPSGDPANPNGVVLTKDIPGTDRAIGLRLDPDGHNDGGKGVNRAAGHGHIEVVSADDVRSGKYLQPNAGGGKPLKFDKAGLPTTDNERMHFPIDQDQADSVRKQAPGGAGSKPTPPPATGPPEAPAGKPPVIEPPEGAPGTRPAGAGGASEPPGGGGGRSGPCKATPAAPAEPAAKPPSIRAQVGGVAVGGGIAITGTVVGKVVEHETGSPTAGLVTNAGIGLTGTAIVAKVGGQGALRAVGGATGAGLAGMGARMGTEYVTGSKTAGDLAGFGAAAGTGAAFGGPVGAIGGVVVHGASELASNGMDYLYAKRDGEKLEEFRKRLVITNAFVRAANRGPTQKELDVYKRMMDKGWTQDTVMRTVSRHVDSQALVDKIFETHLGRKPTPGELSTVQDRLGRGAWIGDIEKGVLEVKASYAYILARAPDADGLKANLDALGRGTSIEQLRRNMADSPEAGTLIGKIYQAQVGRAPTADELESMRDRLASGTSAYELERELATKAAKK